MVVSPVPDNIESEPFILAAPPAPTVIEYVVRVDNVAVEVKSPPAPPPPPAPEPPPPAPPATTR
jgi:hypothetical protein